MREIEKKNLTGMLNSELIKHIRNLHRALEKTDFEFFQKHNIGSAYIKNVKSICEEYLGEWARIIFDTICENIFNYELVTPETEGDLVAVFNKYYEAFEKHINSTVVTLYKKKLANYPRIFGENESFTTNLTKISNEATYKGKIRIHCQKLVLNKSIREEPLSRISISGNNNTIQSGNDNTIKNSKIPKPEKPHWSLAPAFLLTIIIAAASVIVAIPIVVNGIEHYKINKPLKAVYTNDSPKLLATKQESPLSNYMEQDVKMYLQIIGVTNQESLLSNNIEHNVQIYSHLEKMHNITVTLRNIPYTNTIKILPIGIDGNEMLRERLPFAVKGKFLTLLNFTNISGVRVEYESDNTIPK